MSLNVVALVGRVTNDLELKYTQSNIPVCSFSIAVERSYKTETGERQTDFFNCSAWRQSAEFLCKFFQKGSAIAVTGELQQRKYTDKDGVQRSTIEIQVRDVGFCGNKQPDAQPTVPAQAAQPPQQPTYQPQPQPMPQPMPQPPVQPAPQQIPLQQQYQHPVSAQNPVPVQQPAYQQTAVPNPFPQQPAQPPFSDLPY